MGECRTTLVGGIFGDALAASDIASEYRNPLARRARPTPIAALTRPVSAAPTIQVDIAPTSASMTPIAAVRCRVSRRWIWFGQDLRRDVHGE